MKSLCRDAGVHAYPTVKLYHKGKPSAVDGFTAKDIIAFVDNYLSSNRNEIRDEL